MVRTEAEIPSLPEIQTMVQHNSATKLILTDGATPQEVLGALVANDIPVEKFEIALPTLDEIFIRVVREESE